MEYSSFGSISDEEYNELDNLKKDKIHIKEKIRNIDLMDYSYKFYFGLSIQYIDEELINEYRNKIIETFIPFGEEKNNYIKYVTGILIALDNNNLKDIGLELFKLYQNVSTTKEKELLEKATIIVSKYAKKRNIFNNFYYKELFTSIKDDLEKEFEDNEIKTKKITKA